MFSSKTEQDDIESKYYRILQTSLAALSSLLETTQGGKTPPAEASGLQAEIFDSGKFWKLAQCKNSAVKSYWFSLMGTLAKMFNAAESALSVKHKEKITSAVFNQLDDWTDPVLATKVWDAMVYLTAQPDWAQFIDVEKKVLAGKMYPILEGKIRGGQPVNGVIYSYFLPFLGGLPCHSDECYQQFFNSFAAGMNQILFKNQKSPSKGKNSYYTR